MGTRRQTDADALTVRVWCRESAFELGLAYHS